MSIETSLELDQPPLGHLQAIILKTIDELGEGGHGAGVLSVLERRYGGRTEQSQIYRGLGRLFEQGYLSQTVRHDSKKRGPPLKIYKLTTSGRTALKKTLDHHRAIAKYLETGVGNSLD